MERNVTIVLAALLTVFAPSMGAQSSRAQFEVVSIKKSATAQNGMSISSNGNRFKATSTSVKSLILNAYPLRSFQVVGGPDWINTDGFDVEAVSQGPLTSESVKQMLQALLKDRFGMEVHQEMREMPLYHLVVAREGPKVAAAKEDERTRVSGAGRGRMSYQHVSISTLADNLSGILDRVVLDQTGLAGNYTFKLEWTPDGIVDNDSFTPSLFTAVQEQLGLKLESSKGPVEVLVIDNVSKPTEN